MKNQIKYVHSNDLDIMISVEGYALEKHPFYCPSIVLIYAKRGNLHLEFDDRVLVVEKGNFALTNKNASGSVWKSWEQEDQSALMYFFMLHDKFIQKVKEQLSIEVNEEHTISPTAYLLSPNTVLSGLFDSISNYLAEEEELDKQIVELKTLEAMIGVLNYHPECRSWFQHDQQSNKIELQKIIETNYTYNVPLEQLAKISGRSLSTFTRDFKAIYQESPHKWIMKRRLLKAQELLLNTNRRPIDFYMELGFESLPHFSRSFKKEFGMTMTDFRHNNQRRIDSNT